MVIVQLLKFSQTLVLILMVASGVAAAMAGAKLFRIRDLQCSDADDSLIIDGVMVPVLGLYALMVAFTFGQALSLESTTYADILSAKIAVRDFKAMSAILPAADEQRLVPLLDSYAGQLETAIATNRLEAASPALLSNGVAMLGQVSSLDSSVKDAMNDGLSEVLSAARQLQVDSAQRIPTTVFALQSLYYIVCFLLLGYKTAEHGIYAESRTFLVILATLFAAVMFMAVNIGRPGLNAMLFDPLPK